MNISKDPFRVYFPVGALFGLIGVLLWVLFYFQKLPYPGLYHADMMIMGFYTHIAMGFLMTAIPRFTGTQFVTKAELICGCLLMLLFFIAGVIGGLSQYLPFIFTLEILFIFFYFGGRLAKRKSNPPPTFAFLFAGLFCALIGGILLNLQLLNMVSAQISARSLIYYGWTMGPMLGVGGMLIPRLAGYLNQPVIPLNHSRQGTVSKPYWVMGGWTLLFLVSQFGFVFCQHTIFLYLRQLVLSVILLAFWGIYKLPPNKGYLIKGLWLASWFMLLGSWLGVLDVSHRVHEMHIYFIGSVSLMIGCIATRVVVSHGNYPSGAETHSKLLLGLIVFLILAALTRVLAPWTQSYFLHLLIASLFWFLAFSLWLFHCFPKIVISHPPDTNIK